MRPSTAGSGIVWTRRKGGAAVAGFGGVICAKTPRTGARVRSAIARIQSSFSVTVFHSAPL